LIPDFFSGHADLAFSFFNGIDIRNDLKDFGAALFHFHDLKTTTDVDFFTLICTLIPAFFGDRRQTVCSNHLDG